MWNAIAEFHSASVPINTGRYQPSLRLEKELSHNEMNYSVSQLFRTQLKLRFTTVRNPSPFHYNYSIPYHFSTGNKAAMSMKIFYFF